MVRTNQGGSILSFIIIGVVLLGLLLGGAYFVRQRTSAPARVATSQSSKPAPSSDNKNTSSPDSSSKSSAPATTPEASKPSAAPSTNAGNSQGSSNSTPSAPAALPRTGPAETLGSVVGLALLTVSGLAYHRSRRLPATL